ncbi:MAG: CDP-alcohol phosphatidyltransferase [Gemmataceae bacterium]|nr:CDP-alcohol phosphatidyltransferase [Gemmataceae bacterium]
MPVFTRRRVLGWCVHAYTGTGLLLAAAVAALLVQPDPGPETFRACFLLFLAAVFVDATDGTLARLVRIREAVPEFDGRRLDDLVDFLTYTCLPLLLIDRAGLLPPDARWVLLAALVASGYGFCQAGIKTADGAFLGFPSYWNIVAYYLLRLPIDGWAAAAVILVLACLTFVPSRYPYPTQPGRANRWMLALSVPWAAVNLIDLLRPWDGGGGGALVWASAVYPAVYLGLSWAGSLGRAFGRG